MDWHPSLPPAPQQPGEVILLEANAGGARRRHLEGWLEDARAKGAATWLLTCDRDSGGPWAGLNEWLADLLPRIQAGAPELMVSHDYELAYVRPAIQRVLTVRNPTLTDISPDHERVRNYPMDRAYRIGHGLINLLHEWRRRSGDVTPWVVVCDGFDQAGVLVQRFFADLARRRGEALGLTLLLALDPGAAVAVTDRLPSLSPATRVRLDLPLDAPAPVDPAEMTRLAQALEQKIGTDPIEMELHVPHLLQYWRRSDHPENALRLYSWIFSLYTTRGLYEDALPYGWEALKLLNQYDAENLARRWSIVGKIHSCHAGLNRAEEATPLLEELIAMTPDPSLRFRGSYMMGIVHSRYMRNRDLAKAEEWLERSLADIEESNLPPHEHMFFRVFNRNGLALVKLRQGKPEEAIALCRSGFDLLNEHLNPEEHKLHRSVLLYNIAQVYAQLGQYEEAMRYITGAMQMDPSYSEYYNDRGNWHARAGQLEEAYRDYHQAIRLSPPYPEVLANLGACCRRLGRMSEAVVAYTECLDLTPADAVAWAGLAEAYEALGRLEEAAAAYGEALLLRSDWAEIRANRAVLHYQLGRLPEALADLDEAIAASPNVPELYYNRAMALKALHRNQEAVRDLNGYMELVTDPAERAAVVAEVAALSH